MTNDLKNAQRHLNCAIAQLEQTAQDYPSAGLRIDRILALDLTKALDTINALLEVEP